MPMQHTKDSIKNGMAPFFLSLAARTESPAHIAPRPRTIMLINIMLPEKSVERSEIADSRGVEQLPGSLEKACHEYIYGACRKQGKAALAHAAVEIPLQDDRGR